MGIDSIGKKGLPAPPPADKVGSGRFAELAHSGEVSSPREASPLREASSIEPPGATLERGFGGDLDVSAYLDLKASEATAHLAALPAPELEAIRSALCDRMASDPMLVELVRKATGRTPEPSGDE